MEMMNELNDNSNVEFYIITRPENEEHVVAAICCGDGGYIYFSMSLDIKNFNPKEKIKISQILDIVKLCTNPDAKVFYINKDKTKTRDLHFKLLDCLEKNLNTNEEVFSQQNL